MKKKILIALKTLIVLLIISQFVPVDTSIPKYNPDDDFFATVKGEKASSEDLIKGACYDCHSYQTQYPSYSKIMPLTWWLQGHIDEARDEFNFSKWKTYSREDQLDILEECVEVLDEKKMPLLSYMIMHSEAWLSQKERDQLKDYFDGLRTSL